MSNPRHEQDATTSHDRARIESLDALGGAIGQAVAELAPSGVVAAVSRVDPAHIRELAATERAAVARAIPDRQAEFATGRALARRLLEQLGLGPATISVQPDRSPQWPPGTLGSISHAEGWCAVIMGRGTAWRGLGLDIECASRVDPSIVDAIARPEEAAMVARALACPTTVAAGHVFAAKESIYKAMLDDDRRPVEFEDATVVEADAAGFRAAIHAGVTMTAAASSMPCSVAGGWRRVGALAVTLVALPQLP